MQKSIKKVTKWTKKEDAIIKDNTLKMKEMVEKLPGRTYAAISFRRANKGYSSGTGRKAWETRRKNQTTSSLNISKQKKVVKSSTGFKFIMNGIPVTIGANVKNAFVGVDRIEVNF